MKRQREKTNSKKQVASEVPDALAAYGERFMSMFDDYDEQTVKKSKQSPAAAAAVNGDHPADNSSSSQGDSSNTDDDSGTEAKSDSPEQQQQQLPSTAAADRKLAAFLSGRKGNAGLTSAAAAAPRLSKEQLAAQQRKQEQQRLLERKLKKQFMSSKVDKIFDGVQHQQLAAAAEAAAAAGGDEADELTPEQFASMKRDVEQLGATALDKRSAKAYKAAMLAKLGAAADKRPRMPAKIGLGIMKKAKQREAVALQEAIAAGMVKAKGRGKKERAEKAKGRDKGLQEAGPGFKNGVLRLKKSALR